MSRSRTTSASAAPTARWCSVVSDSATRSGSPEPEELPPASDSTSDAGAESVLRLNVGLDRFGALGLLLLSLIPPSVLLVWLLLHLTVHPVDSAMAWRSALFAFGTLLGIATLHQRRHLLRTRWQLQLPEQRPGSTWLLNQPAAMPHPGRPEVMVDLDGWMLLRWQPDQDSGAVWLTVSQRDHPQHWHRLRCALWATQLHGG